MKTYIESKFIIKLSLVVEEIPIFWEKKKVERLRLRVSL